MPLSKLIFCRILSSNDITSLPEGLFDKLTSLYRLDLSSNAIISLPKGLFAKLINLIRLCVPWNEQSLRTKFFLLPCFKFHIGARNNGCVFQIIATFFLFSTHGNLAGQMFSGHSFHENRYFGTNSKIMLSMWMPLCHKAADFVWDFSLRFTNWCFHRDLDSNDIASLPEGLFADLANLRSL